MTSRGWERLLVEPARPDVVRTRRNAHWLAVATVCVGAFMGQLDASIVTLTLPALRRAFSAGLGEVEWVSLAYLAVLVAVVTAVGRLGDVIGRKLLYTYGFAVFTLATVGCGLAPSLPLLLVARGVQALGAAMLQANSVALVVTTLPVDRRARGLGFQGAAQALGLALGPALGGVLLASGGWRWVFFATVPAGVIGTVAGWYFLPRTRERAEPAPFDLAGLLVFAPTVLALLAGLSFGYGWLAVVPVGLLALVLVERRAAAPLLPAALLSRVQLAASVTAALLAYLVLFGLLFAVPFYAADVLHVSSARSGLLLTALPAALGVVSPVAGALADRGHARLVVSGGAGLVALAAAIAATRPGQGLLVVALALAGAGFGAFTPPNNAAVMAHGGTAGAGQVGGLLNMTRGLGTALGVAATGVALRGVAPTPGFTRAAVALAVAAALAALLAGAGSRTVARPVRR